LENKRLKIAVDAMGGDLAPRNEVAGAIQALREANNRFEVVLVGKEDEIRAELDRHYRTSGLIFSIVHASEVIEMRDVPTSALKAKSNSSLAIAVNMHKEGTVDAIVSVGNTGAVMAASTLILGRLEGISRPTIGAVLPTETGSCILVDVGANVDCKPRHLLEFAVMGSIYAKEFFNSGNPRVGLLNIGEEAIKGDEVIQEAYALLSKSQLNFAGNVEGRDVLKGKADVVVCDGFVGNVLLKFAESVLSLLRKRFKRYAEQGTVQKLWMWSMSGTLRRILKAFDYQEHGGVPLLGVNGVAMVGHGNSTPKAIKNLILRAEEMVKHQVNQRIQEAIVALK
jgi:glycerol-3-phosphate acyltransferase PlsX